MHGQPASAVLRIAVVDPRFDEHLELAAEAREGQVEVHYRSSGSEALRLARGMAFDAWIVADELDDMQGQDFSELLRERVAAGMTASSADDPPRILAIGESGTDSVSFPVTAAAVRATIADGGVPAAASGWRMPALPLGVTAAMMAITLLLVG